MLSKGYTFFELLLVFSLIAISTTLAVPALHQLVLNHEDRILQSQLLDAIHLAREFAFIKKVPVGLSVAEADERLLIFVDTVKQAVPKTNQIVAIVQFNQHGGLLHSRSYPFYRRYLRFMPIAPFSDNGLFWFCRKQAMQPCFAVTLNRLGETHIIYPDIAGEIRDSADRVLNCA
ncbi:MAG: hypothetical protein A3F43_04860 [Gammaproteobacteria bacterium RIFCSPHIGHO2_12_FULL_42_10]|nr:MAG: hypothetical protein A3F43_04860 [Gammaproteobacteria bacterium RIFCSPHIGHO2_12_FULL_42_10]